MASTPTKKCTSGLAYGGRACGAKLEARMVQRARATYGDLSTIIFAKSLPVLVCPKCDVGGTATLPPMSTTG